MTMQLAHAHALARDEGEHFHFLNNLFTTKVDGDRSDGALTAMEFVGPRGFSPPLHVHDREDELFYVVEGVVRFLAGDADVTAEAGGCIWAPKQLQHTFQILSDTARVFQVTTPAQFEEFVARLGRSTDSPTLPPMEEVDGGRVTQVAAEFDIQIIGPPMPPLD
jgi:quercetin dioxygenase-like cupin family protein